MKLHFNALIFVWYLLITTPSYAREIIVISYQPNVIDRAKMISKIITNNLGINPSFVTTFIEEKDCRPRSSAIIQICVSSNKELNFPIYRKEIIHRTFGSILNDI